MTLEAAVKILNEQEHRGGDDWLIADTRVTQVESVRVVSSKVTLTAFEALAIAEKYAAGETPESVEEVVVQEWQERFR